MVVDGFFNRETRSPLSPTEQSYLHSSFMYTAGGLAVTAIAARSMFRAGLPLRLMAANPCEFPLLDPKVSIIFLCQLCGTGLVLGVSLVGSIGTMIGTFYTSPDNTVLKHGFWLVCRFDQSLSTPPTKVIPLLLGIQYVSGRYPQPSFLLQSRRPLQSSALYLRSRWLLVICRGNSDVCASSILK